MKEKYPQPPYSYDGLQKPAYALVGLPIYNEVGQLVTFHLVLQNTSTGEPAPPQEMKAFHQAIVNKFPGNI